ncbi:hypothetical protein ACFY1J_24060 [Streptomyces sp. NPDC001406]|uniref:hypothetical protein n=1 Tax=Streptomyces sp. NPDC001406 TaxID=3364572 RepID=UPI0036BDF226
MGYVKSDGTWVHGDPIGAVGAVQTGVTGAGNTGSAEVGGRATARLTLNVTAATGTTPSLTVNVQTSADNATWVTVGSFAAKTGVSSEAKAFAGLDRYIRAQWPAPTGTTPSFTFNISGELN